jgi:IS5 family transposase
MPGIGYSHDSPYLIPLAKELKFGLLVADKGFDSLRNISWVLSRGAKPLIAIRRNAKHRLRVRLRKRNRKAYKHRAKAENIISVIKRKFGEHVSSRSWPALRKEVILLAIAYNVHRESSFLNLKTWLKITLIYN